MATIRLPPDFNRAKKYQVLRENNARQRDGLIQWLNEQGLADQVVNVSQPTAFNVLFVTATVSVAQRLADAPGVLGVEPTGDFRVEL